MIRRAEEKDAPRISALLRQVLEVHAAVRPDMYRSGTQKYSEAGVLELLRDPDCVLFVETDETDRTIGYAICFWKTVEDDGPVVGRRELYIDDICVDENARGQGVGRALYDHILDYAREAGCYNVTLNVWSCNPGAMAFYEKLGMVPYKIGMEKIL